MTHQLSFVITSSLETSEFGEPDYTKFEVRALVDGKSPYANPKQEDVFDAVSVVLQGLEPGEFEVYTCSCGVAGCAGIHEDVVLEADDRYVRWRFPKDPFSKRLDAKLNGPAKTPIVEFSRTQYAEALAGLEAQLNRLVQALPVKSWSVAPASGAVAEADSTTFSDFLAACRRRAEEHRQREALDSEAEGALRHSALQATLPNGVVIRTTLATIGWYLVPGDTEDARTYLRDVLRERVLADPVAALQEVPRDEWESVFWVHYYPDGTRWDGKWAEQLGSQLRFDVVSVADAEA